MGGGEWGRDLNLRTPDTAEERRLHPRETSGRLLGEGRRTSSEPSGIEGEPG